MVLQQAPAAAMVYGTGASGSVSVTVTDSSSNSAYTVDAMVDATGNFKAKLQPAKGGSGPSTIKAKSGSDVATLSNVVWGDVWYCSGQR